MTDNDSARRALGLMTKSELATALRDAADAVEADDDQKFSNRLATAFHQVILWGRLAKPSNG